MLLSLRMTAGVVLSICVVVVTAGARDKTDEKPSPKFVSKTFQDIQKRASERDQDFGAILKVAAREDAPYGDLAFSIQESPSGEQAIIELVHHRTSHREADVVVERYVLRLDEAMRGELQNQKRLKDKLVNDAKKQITQLSGGTLSYGMSMEEVVALKGQPQSGILKTFVYYGTTRPEWEFAEYPGMTLVFHRITGPELGFGNIQFTQLVEIRKTAK